MIGVIQYNRGIIVFVQAIGIILFSPDSTRVCRAYLALHVEFNLCNQLPGMQGSFWGSGVRLAPCLDNGFPG